MAAKAESAAAVHVAPTPVESDTEHTLGSILLRMHYVEPERLMMALRMPHVVANERALGTVLLDRGHVTADALEDATVLLAKLRSPSKHKQAQAMRRLAAASSDHVLKFAEQVRESSVELRKKTTGGGYPAVSIGVPREEG